MDQADEMDGLQSLQMLAAHAVALGAVTFSTIFSTVQTVESVKSTKATSLDGYLYSDKDGVATPESQEAYSVRTQNVLASALSIAGFGVALADAIRATVAEEDAIPLWLLCAAWASAILLLAQRAQVLREHGPIHVYRLALAEAISFFAIALLHGFNSYLASTQQIEESAVHVKLSIAQLVLSLAGFFTCTSYRRRPDLVHENMPVDGLLTASALSSHTYSWPADVLFKAKRTSNLEYSDVPVLDYKTRTENLITHWESMQHRGGMAKVLVLAHAPTFIYQHIMTLVDSFFMVAPQIAMYNLLTLLEARDAGADITSAARFWVALLGVSMIAAGWSSNTMWWYCYVVNIAVRAQLGGLIFNKSTRRKDVKGAAGKKSESAAAADGAAKTEPDKANEEAQVEEDVEDQIKKTRQGVVNLIGVDAKRVADFCTVCNIYLGVVARLSLTFVILGKLLGWRPLVAGLSVQVAMFPINIYFSKKYTDSTNVVMEQRDRVLAAVNEMLGGMRQIKFSALEAQWQKKVLDVREKQLSAQWRCLRYDAVLICLWLTGPIMLSATTIGVFAYLNGQLPPSIAFVSISLLGQIEGSLAWLPELTTTMLDAWVSLKRIDEYLSGPEKQVITTPGEQIAFDDATITWPVDGETDDDVFALRNLNMAFPVGELSVISGPTGSGKSLLLNAILGEAELVSGTITAPKAPTVEERLDARANRSNWILPGALAYVSQQPWLENATIKNNILFGLPLDEQRYRKVLQACALEQDLAILTDGDSTEIGANGINLSGGQKWRCTLARALYSRAGILVMDDIFSAVDAHVGKHIFEQALTGELGEGRTRILVTHHVSLCLSATKYEVHLGNGTVEHAGLVADMQRSGVLDTIIDEEEELGNPDSAEDRLAAIQRTQSNVSTRSRRRSSVLGDANGTPGRRDRKMSHSSVMSDVIDNGHAGDAKTSPKKFIEDETKEVGWVKWAVYKAYLDACGGVPFWLIVALGFGGYEALILGRSWILRLWTETYESEKAPLQSWHAPQNVFVVQAFSARMSPTNPPQHNDTLRFYLSLYFGFAAAMIIEGTLRYLWVFYGSIKASRKLYQDLTHAVLRAPLRWIDTMPVGRVLNRFTADFNLIDSVQAYNLAQTIFNLLVVVGVVIAGIIVSPVIIICAAVLLAICNHYALFYMTAARQIKRLESTAKSPVFELFTAALTGMATIRAFDKQGTYISNMYARLDTHLRMLYYQWLLNRWLSWRLATVGAFFAFVVAAILLSISGIDAALSGFALGFALQYTDAVTWCLRNVSQMEMNMNSTERILEYSGIAIEKQEGSSPPAAWPTEGRLEVEELVVGYADDLPPVLKGLSFSVEGNERIGVVGRTGAGKSSLTLALFRFLEARSGAIRIDGIDISAINLHDLRSRLAIIPQDPVLFSGTVRSNLDPFDEHGDQELRDALERVHLVPSSSSSTTTTTTPSGADSDAATIPTPVAVSNPPTKAQQNSNPFGSLSSPITEGGANLSQGQRQLLTLARAIVSRPKLLILDEATSAVDKATDTLIQRSIREQFRDVTLLVIAHRLSTIADFDRILVMAEGRGVEFGSPKELLATPDGLFRGMVASSGEEDVLRRVILGE